MLLILENCSKQVEKSTSVHLNVELNLNLHLNQSKSNQSFSRELDRIPQVLKISGFVSGNRLGSTTSAGNKMFCAESIIAGLLSSSRRLSVVSFI